jgi:hypothetical protein
VRLKRVALAAGIALAAINVWTGAPLAALWIGSRVQGDSGGASMTAVLVVIVVLALLVAGLVALVARLGAAYDEAGGRRRARRTTPWLKPMAPEREDAAARRAAIGAVDRILVVTVVLAVLAFEAWFFLLSGSPI